MMRDSFEGTLTGTDREERHPRWCRVPAIEAQIRVAESHQDLLIHDACAKPEQSRRIAARSCQEMVQERFVGPKSEKEKRRAGIPCGASDGA
jgi:hypothetical protein